MADLYYAKWHISLGGEMIRPGECFEGSEDEPELRRLLDIGAADRCNPEQAQKVRQYIEEEEMAEELPEETPEEPAVYADPAQIDVMDGISTAPKKRSGRAKK